MKSYAVKHFENKVVEQSRSGGFFTAISDYVLENNGCVYGCILSNNMTAKHIRATTQEERDQMRKSKYIQSNLGTIFVDVKKDLDNNIFVLFTGTSCQIAGLLNFLNKTYKNLVTMDILCSGVPSEKVWLDYLKYMGPKGYCIKNAIFRNKHDYGWKEHIETLDYINKTGKHIRIDSHLFKDLFSQHLILRPACYSCPYKSIEHPGDITIGDFWGIENAVPKFDDNKGCSLVLLNTKKAESIFVKIKENLLYEECPIDKCMQPVLERPFELPDDRDGFWNCYLNKGIGPALKKYVGYNVKVKIKLLLKTKKINKR